MERGDWTLKPGRRCTYNGHGLTHLCVVM